MSWKPGEAVVRREIVNGEPWLGWLVNVVVDSPELLATFSPSGSPFHFPSGDWPTDDGLHPWHHYDGWQGHGTLMLQRPTDCYAIWLFWDGPDREFQGWYINLESPFVRTEIGFDTLDLELDVVVAADRSWSFKDIDLLRRREQEGRFSSAEVEHILELGESIGRMLDSGNWWWDDAWTSWQPDPTWSIPPIPAGWQEVRSTMTSCAGSLRQKSRSLGTGHGRNLSEALPNR